MYWLIDSIEAIRDFMNLGGAGAEKHRRGDLSDVGSHRGAVVVLPLLDEAPCRRRFMITGKPTGASLLECSPDSRTDDFTL